MSKSLKSLAIAGAIACLAASSPTLAQSPPVIEPPAPDPLNVPKIYDSDGRLVGLPLSYEPRIEDASPPPPPFRRTGRVLMSFNKGAAIMHIAPTSLTVESVIVWLGKRYQKPNIDSRLYSKNSQCSPPFYMRVISIPNYAASFSPNGQAQAGYTPAGQVSYASLPYEKVDLRSWHWSEVPGCQVELRKSELAGRVVTEDIPAYKLPFVTK